MAGNVNRSRLVWAKSKTLSPKTPEQKKGWRCSSSNRAPIYINPNMGKKKLMKVMERLVEWCKQ
jgi:hypothetical protein